MPNTKDNLLPPMREEAEKIYAANKEKNSASTIERKAVKELEYLMAEAWNGEEGSFEHSFTYENKPIVIEVTYNQKITDTVDIHKLYKETDLETFLNIVTASRSAVEKIAGKNVANRCTGSQLSDWKARVAEKK